MKRIAVYPGSFDPFTNGHLHLVESAIDLFDELHVVVAVNSSKKPMFSIEERVDMLRRSIPELGIGELDKDYFVHSSVDELLGWFTERQNAQYIIRGVRNNTDMEQEGALEFFNKRFNLTTIYVRPAANVQHISSSFVKSILAVPKAYPYTEEYLPKAVYKVISQRYESQQKIPA